MTPPFPWAACSNSWQPFQNTQSKPPQHNVRLVSLYHCYVEEDTHTHFGTSSFLVILESDLHSHPTHCCLNPCIQITDIDLKQEWHWYWALGNKSGDQPQAGCNSIPPTLWAQPHRQFLIQGTDQSKPVSSGKSCGRRYQKPYLGSGRQHP